MKWVGWHRTLCEVVCWKLSNNLFCFRADYLRFWCCTTYPEYHHVKADVLRIPKMYKIRWFRGFEHELWLLKVGRLWNFASVTKNTDVTSTAMREVRESQGSSSGTWTLEPWTMNHEPWAYWLQPWDVALKPSVTTDSDHSPFYSGLGQGDMLQCNVFQVKSTWKCSEILDSWFVNSKSEINFTILI